jgi:hypothetical protein
MKPALAVKPDPPVVDVEADYASAAAAWHPINTEMRALRKSIENLHLAISFGASSEIPERSAHLATNIEGLITACRRSPLRAASDLEALNFELAELQPKYIAAHEAYKIAQGALAAKIALTYRDRHMAATHAVVAAVEALSLSLQAERDVRADFAAVSPEPTSCLLPDVTSDLSEMDLSRWDSRASIWARRIRNFGVSR